MATKTRHAVIEHGAHTDKGVAKYAETYGISEADAKKCLIQYALNRIATLARYSEGRGSKPKAPKKDKPKATKKHRVDGGAGAAKIAEGRLEASK